MQSRDNDAPTLRSMTVAELLAREIPPREYLLKPIIAAKETAMVHAWRGVGKTYFGLALAYAVATGGTFLGWTAPKPRQVRYVDGEMPIEVVKERLASIVAGDTEPKDASALRLMCADDQEYGIPNLSTAAGQEAIEAFIADGDLIVIDSISTLAPQPRDNDGESWLPMQEWALALRRRGKSVLLLHHDGKGGQQRGTSAREDILDLVLHLRRPTDYRADQGARFELHYSKARRLQGSDAQPFEVALAIDKGAALWKMRNLDDAQLARVRALIADGGSAKDIMEELGVSRATAYRLKRAAEESATAQH